MSRLHIEVDLGQIAEFCKRRGLRELSIFGSAVNGNMNYDGDVDVLIELSPSLYPEFEEWDAMRDELSQMFGRPVDLISRRGITNPFLRHHIMSNREILYAA